MYTWAHPSYPVLNVKFAVWIFNLHILEKLLFLCFVNIVMQWLCYVCRSGQHNMIVLSLDKTSPHSSLIDYRYQ